MKIWKHVLGMFGWTDFAVEVPDAPNIDQLFEPVFEVGGHVVTGPDGKSVPSNGLYYPTPSTCAWLVKRFGALACVKEDQGFLKFTVDPVPVLLFPKGSKLYHKSSKSNEPESTIVTYDFKILAGLVAGFYMEERHWKKFDSAVGGWTMATEKAWEMIWNAYMDSIHPF